MRVAAVVVLSVLLAAPAAATAKRGALSRDADHLLDPGEEPLRGVRRPLFGAAVERLGRCGGGDAIVTRERKGKERGSRIVVRRGGKPCFQVRLPSGPESLPIDARVFGLVAADGSAGPLGIVYGTGLDGPPVGVSRHEVHLLVVSYEGEPLLERALSVRSERDGFGGGQHVRLVPLVWDGDALHTWASTIEVAEGGGQCQGSLLGIPRRGGIRVAEGVPCLSAGVLDVDGDGRVELRGHTPAALSLAPWQAVLELGGDLLASFAEEAPFGSATVATAGPPALLSLGGAEAWSSPEVRISAWPWGAADRVLPGGDGGRVLADLDGDGADELVQVDGGRSRVLDAESGARLAVIDGRAFAARADRDRRELLLRDRRCGVGAWSLEGGLRCAPPLVADLGADAEVLPPFDWTGDGTPDTLVAAPAAGGRVQVVAWAEDDQLFVREAASPEDLDPLHQAPRALRLAGGKDGGGMHVLVRAGAGFQALDVRTGEVAWSGDATDGILEAWALPTSGTAVPAS